VRTAQHWQIHEFDHIFATSIENLNEEIIVVFKFYCGFYHIYTQKRFAKNFKVIVSFIIFTQKRFAKKFKVIVSFIIFTQKKFKNSHLM